MSVFNKQPSIQNTFPFSFQVEFLRKLGYTIKKTKVEMSQNVYHNDVEIFEREITGVFDKAGNPIQQPNYSSYDSEDWIGNVFDAEFQHWLLVQVKPK